MIFNRTKHSVITVVIVMMTLLCISCKSNNVASSGGRTGYDLSVLKTYSLFPRDSDFHSSQSINDALRNRIELGLESSMETTGLQYKSIDEADVIVSYYLVTERNSELDTYNRAVRFCKVCNNQQDSSLSGEDLTVGSLVIDFLDTKLQKSIWRGVVNAPRTPTKSVFQQDEQLKLGIEHVISTADFNPLRDK